MKSSIAVAALSALAQEHRLEIFRLLVRKGIQGIPAGEIGKKLGIPPSTLSFHLSQLKNAGLIQCRRESRTLFYSANYLSMNELMAYLTENCCKGDAETCENSVVSISEASGK
ncbi:MAG: winged helix-turn-helix transcriptional regulator [Candidatus Nitronauta litoralis]|uniref:Winged helix-turn-helix transcriptional regulator n=1 Tax=Candidatus Nitronauta litoralis TaxID=2705533 RepID=A0A7T0G087_9BACT|nr:MAG: winged helix-turn-helix transcriptional regulator [Candidatus Nitronauta litoralis]